MYDSRGYEAPLNAHLKEHIKIHSNCIHISVRNVKMNMIHVNQYDNETPISADLKLHETRRKAEILLMCQE